MAIEITWTETGKPGSGDRCVLEGRGPFLLGRGDQCHIPLEHLQVSRVHAEVTVEGPVVKLTDQGSQNGTYLGGRRVQAAVWGPEDAVQIGPYSLTLREVHRQPAAAPAARPRPAGAPPPSLEAIPGRFNGAVEEAPRPAPVARNAGPAAGDPPAPPPRHVAAPQVADVAAQRFDGGPRGAPPRAAASGRGPETLAITWAGNPWDLVGLSFKNFLLTVITLGIYSFWGKTEVRKRIWSSVRIQGEPLAYTGTGKELLLGFLIVVGLVFLPITLLSAGIMIAFGPHSPASNLVTLLVYVLFGFLWGVAIYRARRYRLSRTLWRGIRGGMAGSPTAYAWTNLWTAALIPFTLGWIMPWRANRLQKTLNGETTLGTAQLGYEGGSSPIYKSFTLLWIGSIVLYFALIALIAFAAPSLQREFEEAARSGMQYRPSLSVIVYFIVVITAVTALWSIISSWYTSQQLNLFARYTSLDQGRFGLKTSALGLIKLFVSNFALSIVSLGILKPVLQARVAKYFIDRLSFDGAVDLARIGQSTAAGPKRGEGLAQAFDVDAF